MWAKLLSKGAAGQTPAAFTPTVTARMKGGAKASLHGGGMIPYDKIPYYDIPTHDTPSDVTR